MQESLVMNEEPEILEMPFFTKPVVGTTLGLLAAISFYVLCMLFPLIGPAGSKMDHAGKNMGLFLGVLVLTLLFSAVAVFSKLEARKVLGGKIPYGTIGLSIVCFFILVILFFGGFAI